MSLSEIFFRVGRMYYRNHAVESFWPHKVPSIVKDDHVCEKDIFQLISFCAT
jgi:hypothetical protein